MSLKCKYRYLESLLHHLTWHCNNYYYTVRLDDVKVLKSSWNFVKTKTTTPGNNIYTLLITFIAFTSFISSKFQSLFFPYKLSYYAQGHLWHYAWATCAKIYDLEAHKRVFIYWRENPCSLNLHWKNQCLSVTVAGNLPESVQQNLNH